MLINIKILVFERDEDLAKIITQAKKFMSVAQMTLRDSPCGPFYLVSCYC